ncbi:MAG: hypothetical protein C4291_00445 [Candidatus Dadabacteria bacterium]
MPDTQGFLGSIVKDLCSNFGPALGNQIRELIQKTFSENLDQIQTIVDKLIKDIWATYEIDLKATNPLHIGIVENGIKIDADFKLSVKRRQGTQEIVVASMQIPMHPEKISVEQLLVEVSKTKLNIQHG